MKKKKKKNKSIPFRDETQNKHFASARKEKLQINNGHNMLCTHSILQVTMKLTLKQKKSFQIHVGSTLYMIEEKR
jgi:hypothetical protein